MLIQEYKEKFPTWEIRKEKLRQKDILKLFKEYKIHSIISRTATELDSVLEFEGLEFCVVDNKKVRLSSDEFFTVRNKQRVSRDFIGHDMSYIRNYCKNTYKDFSNLGLKGGFVYNRNQNKIYYLIFFDIDNNGKLENKALELRQQIGIDTFIVETPRGGYHLYFILESDSNLANNLNYWKNFISDSKLFGIPNIDIKMKGYVLTPGSKTNTGVYQVINESPPAVLKLETWRETIFNKIKPWLIENNIPFSETEDSFSSTDKKSNSSIAMNTSSETCENTGKTYFHSKEKIKKSERAITLTKTAGGLVWRVQSEQEFLEKLLEIRNTRFEEPESFSDSEVEKICSWLWNKHATFHSKKNQDSLSSTDKKSNSSIGVNTSSSLTFLEGELVEIFKEFQKIEKHEQSLTAISSLVQKWFEYKFNTKYSKPINQNAVARLLKQAGFSSKIVRKNNKRQRLWNFSTSLIEKMEKIIESQNWKPTLSSTDKKSNSSIGVNTSSQPVETTRESQNLQESTSVVEPKLDNTTHSTKQFQNPPQEISLKTQESNQDTQMTIHTQEQKECPAEPSSESKIDSETQEQARLQEIELELTAITNSKELSLKEKKELYSLTAEKINSKDLNKISKNLLNFIPSDDYRKICRR